jgi:hypothetical protein
VEQEHRLRTGATAEHHHQTVTRDHIRNVRRIVAQLATRAEQREFLWRLADGGGDGPAKVGHAAAIGHVHGQLAAEAPNGYRHRENLRSDTMVHGSEITWWTNTWALAIGARHP